MVKVTYKASKGNSRLTDFEDLKDYVVRNAVKNIPRTIKVKPETANESLGIYWVLIVVILMKFVFVNKLMIYFFLSGLNLFFSVDPKLNNASLYWLVTSAHSILLLLLLELFFEVVFSDFLGFKLS